MKRALVLGLLLCGCPKDEPQVDETDPLIRKLKAEQERLNKKALQKQEDQQAIDPLARVATTNGKPEHLVIPTGVSADLGDISLTLKDLQRMQNVGNGNVSVSTTDWFVRVVVMARAKQATKLSLDGVELVNADKTWKIARDAQRLGQGSENPVELNTGAEQKVITYFELPEGAFTRGLKIVLTAPGSRVELPLQ
jgi:hypothetical protein